MNRNDFILELNTDPRFVLLVEEILKQRPQIPLHDPVSDNTEVWKAKSAERRGFDIWCAYLQLKPKG